MEIRHAALNEPAQAQLARFYVRQAAPPGALGQEVLSPEEDPAARASLARLKEEIAAAGLATRAYSSVGELALLVRGDLEAEIESIAEARPVERQRKVATYREILGDDTAPRGTPAATYLYFRGRAEAFVRSLGDVFVGRVAQCAALDAFVPGRHGVLVVAGGTGAGKSTLLAHWRRHYQDSHPDARFVFCPLGYPIESLDQAIAYSAWEAIQGHGGEEPVDIGMPPDRLLAILDRATGRGGTIVVIDGVSGQDLATLHWLPATLPNASKVILAGDVGGFADEASRRGWQFLGLPAPSPLECRDFLVAYLEGFGKSLSDGQLGRAVSRGRFASFADLRMFADELRVFGRFEALDTLIDRLLEASSPAREYELVLERWETDLAGPRAVALVDALRLVRCARPGTLFEADLAEALGLAPLAWAELYHSCSELLVLHDNGELTLRGESLGAVVDRRYLPPPERVHTHSRLAQLFGREPTRPGPSEVAYHLWRAEEWDGLENLLLDPDRFLSFDRADLERYWSSLEPPRAIGEAYRRRVEDSADPQGLAAGVFLAMGEFVAERGYREDAEAIFRKALTSARATGLSFVIAAALRRLAAHRAGQDGGEALALAREAVALEGGVADLYLLGLLERRVGNLSQAESAWRAALELLLQRRGGPDAAELLSLGGDLADLLTSQERYVEAEEMLRRVVGSEEAPNAAPGRLGGMHDRLAWVLLALGRDGESMEQFRRAQELFARAGASFEPELARTLGGEGMLHRRAGDYDTSARLLLQSLALYEAGFGAASVEAASARLQLADTWSRAGHHQDAVTASSAALEVYERSLGKSEPGLAPVLTKHADILERAGSKEESERFRRRAGAIAAAVGTARTPEEESGR